MKHHEKFQYGINHPPKNGLYFKFILESTFNTSDFFCLVEGKTDELFYKSIKHNFFMKNTIHYLFAGSNDKDSDILVGKEAVIHACSMIIKKNTELLERCVFIVDHDDFGLEYLVSSYSNDVLSSITVLPVYSFENFFFQSINLENAILPLFELKYKDGFIRHFNEVQENAIQYFALKRVVTASYKFEAFIKLKYEKKYSENAIFHFESLEEFIDKNKLIYEIENMKSLVTQSKKYLKLYENSLNFLEENKDFIKGKVLFSFFESFLRKTMNIEIRDNDQYRNLVMKLLIELNVIIPKDVLLNK